MSTYSDLLRDPRWQKKRLEVMQRDEFTCQRCFDSSSPLHVHHCYYTLGRTPWEYPDSSLKTLCETCHEGEKNAKEDQRALIEVLGIKGLLAGDFNELVSSIYEANFPKPIEYTVAALAWGIREPDVLQFIINAYREYLRPEKGPANE